jgi:hypothetical protein
LCQYYKWDRVSVIFTVDAYASSIAQVFINTVTSLGIRIMSTQSIPFGLGMEQIAQEYENPDEYFQTAITNTMNSGVRIVFLVMINTDARRYFRNAFELGFYGPNIQYIFPDGLSDDEIFDVDDEEFRNLLLENSVGFLGTQVKQPAGPLWDNFTSDWVNLDPNIYPGAGTNDTLNVYVALAHDAVYTVAFAMDKLLRRGESIWDGEALLEEIQQRTYFYGLTEQVCFDEFADRAANYSILNVQSTSGEFIPVGYGYGSTIDIQSKVVFTGGVLFPPDAAERVYVVYSDTEAIVLLTFCCIGILVTLVFIVILMSHRLSPIMHYSSPRFILGVTLGILVGFCNIFAWIGEPTDDMCMARPWLIVMNFYLVYGHMYAKAIRIIYSMYMRRRLKFSPIPDIFLFKWVFIFGLLFIIPMIVWSTEYPLHASRMTNNPDADKVNIGCEGEGGKGFVIYFIILGGLMLLVGVFIAFSISKYHDFFSEATHVARTLYTTCITCCVMVPLLFLLDDLPKSFFLVFIIGVMISNGAAMLFLLGTKVYTIFFEPENNQLPTDETGAVTTRKSAIASSNMSYRSSGDINRSIR